jgi:PPK2 family polyphosphate:nucleotide phosphotransferase
MAYAITVASGKKIKLKDFNPKETGGLTKEQGLAEFEKLSHELGSIQEELYAAGSHAVLLILQGMDTSGKDGTIRNVLKEVNPQGCQIASFKVPTEAELAHDFLWRVHNKVPAKGMLGVFNRSHYEDVLVVRVHNLAPKNVWKKRYEQINNFERLLSDTNTIVLKFFLHISKEEQEERLLKREQEQAKAWKLSVGDWRERAYWEDYQEAYEEALTRCNTDYAPWHIIPADRKWYRNLAISEVIVNTLQPYRKVWNKALEQMSQTKLAELAAYREQLQQNGADSKSS